jgi:hypothetical protein
MVKVSVVMVLVVAAFLAGVVVAQTQEEPLVVRATVRSPSASSTGSSASATAVGA